MQNQIFKSTIPWLSAVLLALAAAGSAVAQGVEASVGSGPNLATVAIEFEDGAKFLFEVRFEESAPPTGLEAMLLLESELFLDFSLELIDFGPVFGFAIDGIRYLEHENVGFGGEDRFWHYLIRESEFEPWSFSSVGASSRPLVDGAWDGWLYRSVACGPGYFKNHVAVWDSVDDGLVGEATCCTGAIDASDGVTTECELFLADLSAPSRKSDAAHEMAEELNVCLDPVIFCEDSTVAADSSIWRTFRH